VLLSFPKLVTKYNIDVQGVLHLGAHLAEEAHEYDSMDVGEVWWVEANPAVQGKIAAILSNLPNQHLIQGLVYNVAGEVVNFNVTNYDGMSSSIFPFGTHPQFSPDTHFVDRVNITSTTIDDIVEVHQVKANFLNMDLQGAELLALQGGTKYVNEQAQYVYTEVNNQEVYKGAAMVDELDAFLAPYGFERVETEWALSTLSRKKGKKDDGWGDALYIRS
jgi:FkbM family methyltransferase